MTKSNLEGKEFISSCSVQSASREVRVRTEGSCLEEETETQAMEKCCLLINQMLYTLAYIPILWTHYLPWGFLFPNISLENWNQPSLTNDTWHTINNNLQKLSPTRCLIVKWINFCRHLLCKSDNTWVFSFLCICVCMSMNGCVWDCGGGLMCMHIYACTSVC